MTPMHPNVCSHMVGLDHIISWSKIVILDKNLLTRRGEGGLEGPSRGSD